MRSLAVVAVALVFAAGCGGASAEPPAPGHTVTAAPATDPARAEALLPKLSDFPHGWASGLNPLTALSFSNGACRPGDAGLSQSAYAGPESFSRGTFTAVTGTTTVWQTEREASAAYARAIAPRAVKCLANSFANELRAWVRGGFHVRSPKTTVSTLRAIGDESRAFQVEVPLTYQGATGAYYVDYAFFRVHRGVANVAVMAFMKPFDQDLLDRLVTRAAAREARAAA